MDMRYAAGLLVMAVLSLLGSQSALGQTGAADASEVGAPQAPLRSQECLRAIEAQAEERGISKAIYEHLRVLSPRHEVLNAVQSQAEFETPIWEYIDASVTETRITNGQGKLAEWGPLLDAVEARFGVDRHILVAIWGIESSYGAVLEDLAVVKPVVQSLGTLACSDGSRAAFWRNELLAAIATPRERRCDAGSNDGLVGGSHGSHSVYALDLSEPRH
jgi:membrane-bound lytic murein transglycosylase B